MKVKVWDMLRATTVREVSAVTVVRIVSRDDDDAVGACLYICFVGFVVVSGFCLLLGWVVHVAAPPVSTPKYGCKSIATSHG